METESASITTPSTLLEDLIERSRLSPLQVTGVVELVLVLFLISVAYLDGVMASPLKVSFWRVGLLWPAIIAYVLLTASPSRRLRDGAIEAFRPLVPLDDDDFQRLLSTASIFKRRREWLAFGIGAACALPLSGAILEWASVGRSGWLPVLYALPAAGLMCSVMGLGIYSSISGTKLLTELSRHSLNVSIFDLASLEPIARWSLGGTLSYIGGITLSLLLLPWFSLQRIEIVVIIYVPLIVTSVLAFFLNMRSIHGNMVEAKRRELAVVRDSLMALSRTLKERTAKGQIEDTQALLSAIKAWTAHEQWVRGLPEWPYTAAIKRNLVLSLLLPGVVGIIREALSWVLEKLLPLP